MVRAQLAVIVAVFSVAVAGCTVAIPAADHFPEARDSQVAEVGVDAADAVDAAVKPDAKDAADAFDAAGTDAVDAVLDAADAPDAVADADAALPDAATPDAGTDAADTDVAPDALDAAPDATAAAVDAGPSCTPSQCDDANPCTSDDCGTDGSCVHSNLAATPCPDDGLPCTGDTCLDGACAHTALLPGWCIVQGVCFASGAATADNCAVCQPATTPVAWTPLSDTTPCSDGTACTVGDHCQAGTCLPGAVTSCDDGNPCTADKCDPSSGCSNPNLDDGSGCPATGVCKLAGACVGGACQSGPKLWTTSMDGGTGGDDRFNGVAILPTGQIVVVGARMTASGWHAGWAQHLDAAADLVENFPALTDPAGDAHYSCAAVDGVGTVAIGGATTTAAVVQLVHADGTQQEVEPFSKFGASDVTRLVAHPSGWLALDQAGHVARLDGVGATVWTATAAAFGPSVLRDVAVLPDGGAIAVGTCAGLTADAATALAVRFSAAGTMLWQRAFGNAGAGFQNVALSGSGRIFVTGARPTASGSRVWFGQLSAGGSWLGDATWASAPVTVTGGTLAPGGLWHLWGSSGANAWQGVFDGYGSLQWQASYDSGIAHGVALLPDGGAVLVGETPAIADGLILRTDAWGQDDCNTSQLCSNLTISACDDGFACTVDVCGDGGKCSHAALTNAACDDGAACTVVDRCAATGQCTGGAAALFDAVDGSTSEWSFIATRADGGAVVSGTANEISRLDASGLAVWTQSLAGSPVSDVAVLPNGWAVVLQGGAGGAIARFTDAGDPLTVTVAVDGGAGGSSAALAVLADDSVVVVGTAATGTPGQTAFVEGFDTTWTGTPVTLPGSFGLSQGLAVAASAKGGCGVLTVEGTVAKIHRLDASLQETWAKPLSVATHIAIAAMPDDGWLVAGPGPKGVAVERYGPDGVFEFAVQWPISGVTDVRALTVLPDGTSAVALVRQFGGFSQGGIARFGPIGGLLSLDWGQDGSQLFDLATAVSPDGIWAVGSAGGGWQRRTDSHGGASCATSGSCIDESLVCDDSNPCTTDGCALGQCTSALPATPITCLNGGVCSVDGACPLLGSCGDGKCNVAESSQTCPADCPASCDSVACDDGDPCTVDYCQDGTCAIGGVPDGTSCGAAKSCALSQCVLPGCGDGVCVAGETATTCPADCPICGDGICGKGENNHLCPADCAKPASGCQNLCGWKSQKPGGGVCWCDPNCTPGAFGDCCDDKATFCP